MDTAACNRTPESIDESTSVPIAAAMPSPDPAGAACLGRQCAEALLGEIESMLRQSYASGEATDAWWIRFTGYYRTLQLDADTRDALNSRLDWLFCRHGETGWPSVRLAMLPTQGNGTAAARAQGSDEEEKTG